MDTDRMTPDVQHIVRELKSALGVSVTTGTLSLNFNEDRLLTYDIKVHGRVAQDLTPKTIDRREHSCAT